MPVVPQTIIGKLEFYEEHLPVWSKDPAAIGLTPVQLVELANRTSAARAAYDAAHAARSAAKASTLSQAQSIDAMHDLGGDLIKTIRTFAETNDDPAVFVLAEIPAPAPPTPAGPPEQPTELAANFLLPFGIGLSWKGSVAQGAYFGIWRRLDGENEFTLVATSKEKSFDDQTLPAGAASVSYYISAHRESFTVNGSALSIQIGANGNMSLSMAA